MRIRTNGEKHGNTDTQNRNKETTDQANLKGDEQTLHIIQSDELAACPYCRRHFKVLVEAALNSPG